MTALPLPVTRPGNSSRTPDPTDMAAVYAAHGPRCYALAYRLLRDSHLAQDVVQETFLAWSSHPQRYDPARGSLGGWLSAITHHKAVDAIRRAATRTARDVDDTGLVELACPTGDVAETAGRNERRDHVVHALRQLPENQRTPILLAYFGGYTQNEIAARLNTPLGTIKYRTSAGMRQLRTHLGGLTFTA